MSPDKEPGDDFLQPQALYSTQERHTLGFEPPYPAESQQRPCSSHPEVQAQSGWVLYLHVQLAGLPVLCLPLCLQLWGHGLPHSWHTGQLSLHVPTRGRVRSCSQLAHANTFARSSAPAASAAHPCSAAPRCVLASVVSQLRPNDQMSLATAAGSRSSSCSSWMPTALGSEWLQQRTAAWHLSQLSPRSCL